MSRGAFIIDLFAFMAKIATFQEFCSASTMRPVAFPCRLSSYFRVLSSRGEQRNGHGEPPPLPTKNWLSRKLSVSI